MLNLIQNHEEMPPVVTDCDVTVVQLTNRDFSRYVVTRNRGWGYQGVFESVEEATSGIRNN